MGAAVLYQGTAFSHGLIQTLIRRMALVGPATTRNESKNGNAHLGSPQLLLGITSAIP